ncbi:MAG: PspA/IM30 family protein [Bacteroidales bacterium]|nr:PspA/IM30 family protein [Bacteroidales bacterium]
MGIIRKVYDKGEQVVNEIKKKTQNPLREFEKELNNLKVYLKEAENLTAHFNALKIRAEKDIPDYKKRVAKYAEKAKEALEDAKKELISEKAAETIALNALKFKKTYENRIDSLKINIPKYDNEIILLKEKISDLRLKIEHYEEEYKFLKKHTKPSGKEKISDFFYGDEGVVKRLDKLKNNLLNQNEKDDFLKSHSDDLYDGLDDVDVTEEYENLKSELKK